MIDECVVPLGGRNPSPDSKPTLGHIYLVGAGPGEADLITVRGDRALQDADVILYDSLIDSRLLDGRRAERVYVGKRCGKHSMSQPAITALMIRYALAGKRVVRLKGGDPSVFGRVGEEALALSELGIGFDIVPGVTSAVAAPMLAGIPVTHRGVADSFVTVTAHKRRDDEPLGIPAYRSETTLILLMPLSTLPRWQPQLLASGYPEDLPIAFVSEGCSGHQRVIVSTVGQAHIDRHQPGMLSPCLVVVGNVVALRERIGLALGRESQMSNQTSIHQLVDLAL